MLIVWGLKWIPAAVWRVVWEGINTEKIPDMIQVITPYLNQTSSWVITEVITPTTGDAITSMIVRTSKAWAISDKYKNVPIDRINPPFVWFR